ncbi:DUF6415 family natural product biosynthesis protein [Streptomyces violascens]|uniref:DUF6415 family natural product biosynthesis protein n=1 Tax=Streptomyces violascens TaxID=67381 RepID=UPI003663E62D
MNRTGPDTARYPELTYNAVELGREVAAMATKKLTPTERESAALDCDRALVAFQFKPSPWEIDVLTARVHGQGVRLYASVQALPGTRRADAALRDWAGLMTTGPEPIPLGRWTYLRALARTVRVFLEVLDAADAAKDGAR